MADEKISQMAVATLSGTEMIEVVQGGVNKRTTPSAIAALAAGGVSSVNGETGAVTGFAKLASPAFTGTPTAPTAAGGTNTTQVATTAFVTAALAPYVIDQVSTSTAAGTITLDMNSQIQRSHVGSATFATPKTMALSNTTNSLFFKFFFEITNVAATLTFPADWISADDGFDGTTWTPPLIGKYYMNGDFNDTSNEWTVSIYGPAS